MTSARHSLAILSTLVALALTNTVHAQATDAIAVPPMTCTKPGDFPPLDRGSPDMTRFQKRMGEYKVCVDAYAHATGDRANEFAAQSRAYVDAANKAINDYNAYVTDMNEKANRGGKNDRPVDK